MKTLKVLAASAALLGATAVNAAVITQSGTFSLATTNWIDGQNFNKFDGTLGTLTSVSLEITGHVQGNAMAESLDAAPATVTLDLQASMGARVTGLAVPNPLQVNVNPLASQVFNASAFDGTIDFGGASGVSFLGLTANDTSSSSTSDAAWMALFVDADGIAGGLDSMTVEVDAQGLSAGSGAGNLITQFNTSASADWTVTYNYTTGGASVPTPAPLALMGLFAGFLAWRRKR